MKETLLNYLIFIEINIEASYNMYSWKLNV